MNCFANFFCSILDAVGQHIARHSEGYGMTAGALGLSFVKNWPEILPKTIQDWWTWARNTFQTALPISRVQRSNPIPPVVNPANPTTSK